MANLVDKIKALSVHAPHAYAICLGKKQFEYRSWATKKRGWVLIHATASTSDDSYFHEYGINPKTVYRQAIIGASYIADCLPDEDGGYMFKMTRSFLFKVPVLNIKGQIKFWGHSNDPTKVKGFAQAIEQMAATFK